MRLGMQAERVECRVGFIFRESHRFLGTIPVKLHLTNHHKSISRPRTPLQRLDPSSLTSGTEKRLAATANLDLETP